MVRFSRKDRTRSSGQSGSDRRADVSLIRRRFPHRLRTRGQSTRDTDSHGVSDPPDRRGAIASARARVAHAMVSCSDRATGACAVGGKERRPSCWCRALTVELAARESVIGGGGGGLSLCVVAAGGILSDAFGGTTSISEVVPQVVLCS